MKETEVCVRPDRDDGGRFQAGTSGNPAGKPARKPYLKLLELAERCGAAVVVMVPTRRPRPSDEPPRAA